MKVFEIEALRQRLMKFLEAMNTGSRGTPMKVVFFNQIIGHIVRVCRALRSDRGNVLMVGVGGSGKDTTIKLATYVSGYRLFTINTRRYFSSCHSLSALFVLQRDENSAQPSQRKHSSSVIVVCTLSPIYWRTSS